MRVADVIATMLADGGVSHTFGIPGLHTLTLHDALIDEPRIRHIGTSSEAAATYAADGFARVAGRAGVVLTTSGVAAFSTLGALSEADLDGSPILLLAGQIPSALIGAGRGVLHETDDQAAAFSPACGYIARPRTAIAAIAAVREALLHLQAPHARPAYVELPTDLLDVEVTEAMAVATPRGPSAAVEAAPDDELVARAGALLSSAERPLILVGGAVILERATEQLAALATTIGAPVLHSVPGRGAIAPGHPLDAGPLVAGHGSGPSLLADADVVLVAGDRLDEQTTGAWSLTFGGPVIQLHPREEWLGRGTSVDVALRGAVKASLEALSACIGGVGGRHKGRSGWDPVALAAEARAALRDSVRPGARPWLAMMDTLRTTLPTETIVVSDAAAFDSWTGFFWEAPRPATSLFPWGSAALGFGLPAGIGASLAAPGVPVLVCCGDGGFAYVAMELATAVRTGANVIVVVADDGGYRSIAEYQLQRFARSADTERGGADLIALAEAFSVPARRVEDVAQLPAAVASFLDIDGPALIQLTERTVTPW